MLSLNEGVVLAKRVYEKARELGIESKDLLEALLKLGFEVKTAAGSFSEDMEEAVKNYDFKTGEAKAEAEIIEDKKTDVVRDARREAILKRMMGKGAGKAVTPMKTVSVEPIIEEKETAPSKHAVPKSTELEQKPRPKKTAKLEPLRVMEKMTPQDIAKATKKEVSEVLRACMTFGVMATSNQRLGLDVIEAIAEELGYFAILVSEQEFYSPPEPPKKEKKPVIEPEPELDELDTEMASEAGVETKPELKDDKSKKPKKKKAKKVAGKADKTRAPVVTVMGHVDHGKTTLLDHIRNTNVVAGEKGGITQHIGAYVVKTPKGYITFVDTPGHEAFTAMRARGAELTDIVVLIVAQDDSLMPQTREAIDHARAAGVPIIVAINKMDLPGANADRVKNDLAQLELLVEDWGGDVQCAEISALSGDGVDELLDEIVLQAEMLELVADPTVPAKGVVVEALLDKFRGATATILVQEGTLKKGDSLVAGLEYGRIRSMEDERGKQVNEAPPSTPVVITGLNGVPQAGDIFEVVKNDTIARKIVEEKLARLHQDEESGKKKISLEDFFAIMEGKLVKNLSVVIKADVDGSLEAVKGVLSALGNEEVKVNIVSTGVGGITENDVLLASTSNAVILGFSVKPDSRAKKAAEKEGVDIKTYDIIYELQEDVIAALEGMLEPEMVEEKIGTVEIRQVFRITKVGKIAGCYVLDGEVHRDSKVEIVRAGEAIGTGKISTLKRFKDDVKEVAAGFECGIEVEGFRDYQEGDILNIFETKKVVRRLSK